MYTVIHARGKRLAHETAKNRLKLTAFMSSFPWINKFYSTNRYTLCYTIFENNDKNISVSSFKKE